MTFLATIGRAVLGLLAAIGSVTLFAVETVSHLARPPFYPREFAHALLQIGYFSLPVVGLTTIFTGGALALQIYAGGARFSAEQMHQVSLASLNGEFCSVIRTTEALALAQ